MISFYPGPSRVHDEIPSFVDDAFKAGILSINHRSEEFMNMCEKTVTLMRNRLGVPKDYTVFFTSSATECWEIIAQSVIVGRSFHLYNGAFGEKWFEYTRRLQSDATALPFLVEGDPDLENLTVTDNNTVICITQNETSNGTQVTNKWLRTIAEKYPGALLAVDATSSIAGIKLDFKAADIWYASVQKCFGLPAGLGIMLFSPRALDHAKQVGERDHYNSVTFMANMMDKWQTPFTPNVLGIYLLMRVLENSPAIKDVHEKVVERYQNWIDFLAKRQEIKHLVGNKAVRSFTVIPVTASPEVITKIKAVARKNGILLGEGYGSWKSNTFRIANFPALKKKEIKTLMSILKKF